MCIGTWYKMFSLGLTLPYWHCLGIPGPCLESLVSYLYTGILRLNRDNVEQTLEAATYLDITSAVELCQRYLRQGEDGGMWHQTEEVLAPGQVPEQSMKLADEKPIVKNDEEFAELELFIESHLSEVCMYLLLYVNLCMFAQCTGVRSRAALIKWPLGMYQVQFFTGYRVPGIKTVFYQVRVPGI